MSSSETYPAFDADRRMVRFCRVIVWASGLICVGGGFGLLGVIWSPAFTGDYDNIFIFVRLGVSLIPLAIAIVGMTIVTAMWRSHGEAANVDGALSEASRTTGDLEAAADAAADGVRCPFCKHVFLVTKQNPITEDGCVKCPECNGIFDLR